MSHRVALAFEDGVTRFITCAEDQTVADASYRSRINIPMDCRDGVCGTCKAFCESGEYDGGDYLDDALSAAESAEGYVLPCRMRPRSELVLQIASTSAVAKTSAATFRGTVTDLRRLSPTTVAVTVEIADRATLAFLPGQYVTIAVPGTEETRSYSFSNGPDETLLTFLVKLMPGGAMSTYLGERAAVGDALTFTGPNGSFFLRESEDPLLLLAGGTGLAPVLSILRALRASGSSRPVHLLYGATTDDDVVELDTIADLASSIDGLTWDYCVADQATTARNQGYVTSLIEDRHLHGGAAAVYLCGPPAMVDAVRGHFADRGTAPAGFYYEKFALAAAPRAAGPAPHIREELLVTPDGRSVAGQELLRPADLPALTGRPPVTADHGRTICGQPLFPAGLRPGDPAAVGQDDALIPGAGRALAGQELVAAAEQTAALPPPAIGEGGYQDHVDIVDAIGAGDRDRARRLLGEHDNAAARRPRFVTPGRFEEQVVIVTGAAQGIGRAVAERAAAEGAQIVLVDRSPLVHEVAEGLLADGAKALAIEADLEHYDSARSAVEEAASWQGHVDVLVNNVGGAINFKPFVEFTEQEITAEITRSLLPTLWCCRAVLPGMVARGRGVIVNVSSAATRGIHRIPYSAAKGGVNALTASLAFEYAEHGIRVVATAPGGTEAPPRRISRGTPDARTDEERAWFQAHVDQTLASSFLGRYGTLDEQAAAILFLASDEASYITGSVLPVGGGDLG